MSFREPLTSATDVDTGAPGVASVYMTQGGTPGGTVYGLVGFRDGFPSDTDATITRTTSASGHDGTSSGGLAIKGGTYGPGVAAPELDLNVESDSPGFWRPVARLFGLELRPSTSGFATFTTDSGGNGFLPHGLGQIPTGVLITPGPQLSGLLSNIVAISWTTADSTNFSFYVHRTDTSAALASQTVRLSWHAFV